MLRLKNALYIDNYYVLDCKNKINYFTLFNTSFQNANAIDYPIIEQGKAIVSINNSLGIIGSSGEQYITTLGLDNDYDKSINIFKKENNGNDIFYHKFLIDDQVISEEPEEN